MSMVMMRMMMVVMVMIMMMMMMMVMLARGDVVKDTRHSFSGMVGGEPSGASVAVHQLVALWESTACEIALGS
jgi:hypothetical protein